MDPPVIVLDFETRSRVDLRTTGASVYARDPSTTVLCLAWQIRGRPTEVWTPADSLETLRPLFEHVADGGELHAHNALFERLIWDYVCRSRMGWPAVPATAWRCSLAAGSRLTYPRALDAAARVAGLSLAKDSAGRRIMLQLCRPTAGGDWDDSPEKLQALYDYCRQDVDVESMLMQVIPPLPPGELELWQLDQKINLRGLPIDTVAIGQALLLVDQVRTAGRQRLQALTGGTVFTVQERQKLLAWLAHQGVDLPDLRADTVATALDGALPEAAREALELRQSLARGSVAKLQAMQDRCDTDGRVRGSLTYHGAATGRWAGAGIQIQNFPRGDLSASDVAVVHRAIAAGDAKQIDVLIGSPLVAISGALRSFICAPAGRTLLVSDFRSIEARILAWLAGEASLLATFSAGGDPYTEMAADMFGVRDVNRAQRQVGKMAVLGCGYGMGARQFHRSCRAAGLEITNEFALRAVLSYRRRYPKIPNFWRQLNAAALAVLGKNEKKRRVGDFLRLRSDTTRNNRAAPVRWLGIELPSGRELRYHSASVEWVPAPWAAHCCEATIYAEVDQAAALKALGVILGARHKAAWHQCRVPAGVVDSSQILDLPGVRVADLVDVQPKLLQQVSFMGVQSPGNKWGRKTTYGGKLAENVVQAVARDFLAASMLRLDAAGYELIATVHDEIIAEADAAASLDDFSALMRMAPDWGDSCPLAVESYAAQRYRK